MTEHEQEVERLAADVHAVYCNEYAARFGKPYWTGGDYSKLDEPTKNYDRAFVRWHLAALMLPRAELAALRLELGATKERERKLLACFQRAEDDLTPERHTVAGKRMSGPALEAYGWLKEIDRLARELEEANAERNELAAKIWGINEHLEELARARHGTRQDDADLLCESIDKALGAIWTAKKAKEIGESQ